MAGSTGASPVNVYTATQQELYMKEHNGFLTASQHNDLKAVLEGYAWPGGYPMALLIDDGAWLCSQCVRENVRLIIDQTHDERNEGWRMQGAIVHDDDEVEYCAHCNERI